MGMRETDVGRKIAVVGELVTWKGRVLHVHSLLEDVLSNSDHTT